MITKIISYNIWHGQSLQRVIDFLLQEEADIVLLQECATVGKNQLGGERNIFEELQDKLRMYGFFSENFTVWEEDRETKSWNFGCAILSKKPIISQEAVCYLEKKHNYYGRYGLSILVNILGKCY